MHKFSLMGPPVALVVIGLVVYVVVVRLSTPRVITLKATPIASAGASSSDENTTPSATPVPTPSDGIDMTVSAPSSADLKTIQQRVDGGQETWRLDPLDAAKGESIQYGFATQDAFSLFQPATGQSATAVIQATHSGKHYQITMSQPGTTGAKGVWVITKITGGQ